MDVTLLQPIFKRLITLEEKLQNEEPRHVSSKNQTADILPNDEDIKKLVETVATQLINSEIASMKQSMMRAVNIKIESLVSEKINEVSKTVDSIKNEMNNIKTEIQQQKETIIEPVVVTANKKSTKKKSPPQGVSVDI
jgi:hypothetical protein